MSVKPPSDVTQEELKAAVGYNHASIVKSPVKILVIFVPGTVK